jgi:hypothetical protein
MHTHGRENQHADTKNSRNLASGKDPERELAKGINPASTRILGGRSIIITVFINIYIHSPFLLSSQDLLVDLYKYSSIHMFIIHITAMMLIASMCE